MKKLDTLKALLKSASKKHHKFNGRLKKKIRSGNFQHLSPRKQRQQIKRVKKFRSQLQGLYLKLAMAGVAGLALNQATVTETKAQNLGPFNRADRLNHPLRPPLALYSTNMFGHALGDIDQDGDIDLLVGYYDADGYVRTFKNYQVENGASRPIFKEVPNPALPYTISNDDATFAVSFVDLDGDGLEELAVAVGYYQPVEFLQNNNNGTGDFTLIAPGGINITADDYTSTMVSVDLDNDGDLDLITGTTWARSGIYFWRNDGSNNFTDTNHSLNDNGIDYGTPAFIDIDFDGDQDMFMGDNTGVVHFFLNQESGGVNINPDNFLQQDSSPLNFLFGTDFGSYTVPRFVDLDMDGDKDMVLSKRENNFNPSNGYIHVFYNDGSNNFTEATGLDNPFGGVDVGSSATPAIVDIDNDGDNDVFLGSLDQGFTFYENTNNIFARNDPANQLAFFQLSYPSPGYDSTVVEFADFDQDGDHDGAFVGTLFDDQFFYFLNTGTLETTQSASNLVNQVETSITFQNRDLHLALGDIDADGDLDALVAGIGSFSPPIKYFENTGGEIFSAGVNIFAFGDDNPDLADVDHDGDADLVLGQDNGSVEFWESDGTTGGDVSTMTQLTGVSNPLNTAINSFSNGFYATPEFGDIDGDGDLDYMQGMSNGQVVFARNDNQVPSISLTLDPAVSFTENGAAVQFQLSAGPSPNDPDNNTNWIQLSAVVASPLPGDELIPPGALPVGITATWDPVGFRLDFDGHLDKDSYVPIIDQIAFLTTSNAPGSSRTIEFFITDDDATVPLSAAGSISIPIVESNDAPVLSANITSLVYTENDAPTAIGPLSSIIDVDDTDLASAVVTISNNFQSDQDVLGFTDQNGISGTWDSVAGTMTLSGTAPIADYLTALNSITYQNTSEDPVILVRTISVTVNDGNLNSGAVTKNLSVNPVNDVPTVTAGSPPTTYQLGTLNFLIDGQMTPADLDDVNLSGGLIRFEQNYIQGKDVLALGTTNGITGNFIASSGELVLSGTQSLADYQDALRSITYFNADDPSQPDKQISVVITDASNADSAPYLISFSVGNPIDAATIDQSVTVGSTSVIDVIGNATFPPGDVISTTIVQDPTQGSVQVLANQTVEYTANSSGSGTDVITYQLCNQNNACDTDVINITLLNAPPTVGPSQTKAPPGGIATLDLAAIVSDAEGNIDLSTLRIVTPPSSGAPASIDGAGILTVDYTDLTFTGIDQLTIEVCDLSGECTQQEITIEVGDIDGVTVFNVVSPNGDNINDFLKIQDIEFFQTNHVFIYNRMGNKVWDKEGYDNDQVKFEGIDNNGTQLPTGTYYYTIELVNSSGETKRQSGFFVMNR